MRNGLGVAALVLSIVGALSGLIPLLFWLAGTLGLLAVIFGFVGRSRASKGTASNGGVALSGAIVGLAALGRASWGLVITVNATKDAVTAIDQALSTDPVARATKSSAPKPLAFGKVASEPPFALKILSAERAKTVSSSIDNHTAQGSWVVVKVLVKNTGDGPAQFDGMDSGLLDADAKQYNVDSSATISQNLENSAGIYDKINPGQKVTRTLVFDLPEKTTPRVIAMFGSEGSNGAFMYLQ
ncbi:DUF4190 domain-containing protein [Microtetraspora fusca]|uniref:DUF4190 domain-containing protein n=1 Tax=Microtetraspora fusca TaxID=1997 RepID=UPI000836B05D|nr:DUF4190 domain-containing protein [Microtetraspora fusca]